MHQPLSALLIPVDGASLTRQARGAQCPCSHLHSHSAVSGEQLWGSWPGGAVYVCGGVVIDGGEESREAVWEPEGCPVHLLRGMTLSLRASLRPLRPHTHVSALRGMARQGSAFISVVKPLTPPRPSAESRSATAGAGVPGGRARQGERSGNGSGTLQGRGPLGQALGPH